MSIAEKFEVIADAVYDKALSDRDEKIWYMITDGGTKYNYTNTFAFSDWSGYKFAKPIKPTGAIIQMFYSCYNITALPENIDFSEICTYEGGRHDSYTYRRGVCGYCYKLQVFPDLNMRAIGGLEEWFQFCRALHTIELLRVKRETIYTNTFTYCDKLTEIRFDGEIGQDISFKDSPLLSDESLENIAEHMINTNATITLHSTVKNRINGTPIYSTITGKGWTIA